MRTAVRWTLLGLLLVCFAAVAAPVRARARHPVEPGAARSTSLPDLSRFSLPIRRHIEAREAWRRRVLESAAATAEQRAEADGELAVLYHAYQLYPAAEELYTQLLHDSPADHRWAYYLGQIYRSTNRLAESARSFGEALSHAPNDVPTLIRLAEVYLDQDRTSAAEPLLASALELAPDAAAVHFYLGQIAAESGRLELAIHHFELALELQPASTAVHTPLGLAYRDQGRLEEARKHLEAAGDVDIALDDPLMARLHGLSQGLWEALRGAEERLQEGQVDAARAALTQAAAVDPLAPEPRLRLAQLLAKGAEWDEAERLLELALFLAADDDARPHVLSAAMLRAKGEPERAVEHYRKALERDPDAGLVRFDLGQTLQSLGRLEEATAQYGRAAQSLGDNPIALLAEATMLLELDRCLEAKDHLAAGLRRVPNQGVWVHALVRTLAGCPEREPGGSARALELGQSLFTAHPTPGHAAAVAMALAASGRHVEALAWQRRAVDLARQIGRADLAALLERDLSLYAAGRERTVPWRGDEMDLFSAGTTRPGAG